MVIHHSFLRSWLCLFAIAGTALFALGHRNAGAIDFGNEILPILSENCFHCHGPDARQRQAGLRLDTEDGSLADLGGYAAIVPGVPDASALIQRVRSQDRSELMPPPETGKTLTKEQIAALESWIEEGGRYQQHWSFQPIKRVDPPSVGSDEVSAIDRFVIARLKQRGLSLSAPISKEKWIRRATIDLTGLPPTWKEVEEFVDDTSPQAFQRVVDRLLDSERYGERWGRHWLDLARYADTHGASAIGFKRFPFSYTYRDYVVRAFNRDLPYNQFVLEQLAADQLGRKKNDPSLAALGFLTVGRQYRNPHDRLDDQIDVLTRGMLGLTVACARCHDHKFDPIPTADYYALHCILASSDVPVDLPLIGDEPVSPDYSKQLIQRERLRDDVYREQGDVMRGRLRMQVGMYLTELAKGTPEMDTSTAFLSYRTEDLRPIVLERWRRYLVGMDKNDPVFGPWHRLATIGDAEDFSLQVKKLVEDLREENGDPNQWKDEQRFATKAPKWNPRVLDVLEKKQPQSLVEVAEAYGELFSETYRNWLTALLEASLEAAPGGTLVPDQDLRHRVVNSAIERQIRHHLTSPESPTSLSFDKGSDSGILNRGVRDGISPTAGAIDSLNLSGNAPPRAMIMREKLRPEPSFVFVRGNPIRRGRQVQPAFLSVLPASESASFENGARRLGLARAIIDPGNPLTRRVIVNWVWQHHFGRGLVRTPDDFGTRGEPPTHPELLDYLAEELIQDNWSLKNLHQKIMLSSVYRQSSLEKPQARRIDPENRLLWRMPPRKLEMEAMRDSLLFVSGELDFTMGGQPFEENGGHVVPRRSLYAFLNRDVISDLASTFDGANPSACTVRRPETMVPQQTLFALNSEFVLGRAAALAVRPLVTRQSSDRDKIVWIYRIIFGRSPSSEEIEESLDYLNDSQGGSWERLIHVLLASNEFHFVD